MHKLLIVLAIQFCLPRAAMLLRLYIPGDLPHQLGFAVGAIHTASLTCALVMLWPRWHALLLVLLTLVLYWGIWREYYLAGLQQTSRENYLIQYYKYFCGTALLAGSFALLLFFRQMLLWQPYHKPQPPQKSARQINLADLIYHMALLTMVVGMVSALYREHRLGEQDLTNIFRLKDFWLLALAMSCYYNLLQPSIRWLNVGLSAVVLGGLWFVRGFVVGDQETPFESLIFASSSLGFCSLSILLYRYAGFRIVPRRELALNSSSSGQL
jgi:hypothetical protein